MTAIAGKAKMAQVRALGADRVIERGGDIVAGLGENAVDVAVVGLGKAPRRASLGSRG